MQLPTGHFASLRLNERAHVLARQFIDHQALYQVLVHTAECGAALIDCGCKARGGLQTGLQLARVCLAGLAEVTLVPGSSDSLGMPRISVTTELPLAACLAAQYAGWQIQSAGYFAMGSGPMRAVAGVEPLIAELGGPYRESLAVGVLEGRDFPPNDLLNSVATRCGVRPDQLTLLAARTKSLAGMVQVVARSVETALHKLHALHFDLTSVVSAYGTAPLPTTCQDDLQAIGKTNDAVLYGGDVHLWVQSSDDLLQQLGPQVPSNASSAFGQPFAEIFAAHGHDFYKIDPLLFSPARVVFHNLSTGKTHGFGALRTDVLSRSFGL